MANTTLRTLPFSYSVLIIGWILASLPFTAIAFLPHNSLTAAQTGSMSLSSSSAVDVDASSTSKDNITKQLLDTADESEGNPSMIYRYNSPFFPISSSSTTTTTTTNGDNGQQRTPSSLSALIILNTPIKCTINKNGKLSGVLGALWETSSYRICADGGANRLYDATTTITNTHNQIASVDSSSSSPSSSSSTNLYLPNVITGDLDSVRPDVLRYYEERGVSIVRVEDQNFHDLDKSLMAVEKWITKVSSEKRDSLSNEERNTDETNNFSTFIYGGFGGRFDQEMGCINALCVWGKKERFQHTSLALYDEETCAFALPESPTKNEIRIRFPGESSSSIKSDDDDYEQTTNNKVGEGPTCGLIPIGGRCDDVRTTGLQWNLEGDVPLEFGGLVSSSNRVVEEVVTVKTSSPLLFTAEMIVEEE
mmetsp:Transcript_2333/g.5399  ORF Transcript_2333/g.5399 Transcript_2333/m.5399 type:complete len:422 (-) Transcript_2333:986-2251(-)